MLVFYSCHTDMPPVCHSGLCPLQASLAWPPEPRETRHIQSLPDGEALAPACGICSLGLAFFIELGWIFPEELILNILLHSRCDCQHKLPVGSLNPQPQVDLPVFLHACWQQLSLGFLIPSGLLPNVLQKCAVSQSFKTKFIYCSLLVSGCTELFLSVGAGQVHSRFHLGDTFRWTPSSDTRSPYYS